MVVAELDAVLRARLVPITSHSVPDDFQRNLDTAVKKVRQQVMNELRKHVSEMDHIAFERLVGALLSKLGYTNVEVTKRSGDGGVDVRAILVAGGVANIQTCVQAKRQHSVGRPVIQNLRGSLSAHEAGLVVTSGSFTREAIEEAKVPTRVPIALIDGRKLAELLLDHEIGVRHEKVTLYRLELSDLTPEGLETIGATDTERC